ncbi:MAG: acyl-CoA dehydrogenase family protein [Deltaproteobacteria bacterium]|nr:acyl-CoA dehydrogenase family protein [Deltaproteobacteria bacterium]
MNFDLTEEQALIAKSARDFAARVLAPRAADRDVTGRFPVEELQELASLGLLGVTVPGAFGGSEAGTMAYSLAMTEIARADASVSVAMAVTNMAAELICRWGTETQKKAHVPKLVGGPYLCGAFALSEPQSGSDAAAMKTTATPAPGGYRIAGTKQWITSGTHAGLFVIWAKTNPGAASRGISAFLVEKGTPGLTVGKAEEKMGLHGSSTVQLHLEDLFVPEDQRLGREGDGFRIAMTALDGGRIGIASQALGIATAALEQSARYASERVQFGVPLAEHQAIRFMLADMSTALEASRLLTWRAAFLKDQGLPFTREAAMAKLYSTEAATRACDSAIQIHGGYGYTREFPVERYLRDARVGRIYEGTSEVQRMVIAREILKSGVLS